MLMYSADAFDSKDRRRVLKWLVRRLVELNAEKIKTIVRSHLETLREDGLRFALGASNEVRFMRRSYRRILVIIGKCCEGSNGRTRFSIIKKYYKTKGGRYNSTYIYKALNYLEKKGLIERDPELKHCIRLTEMGLLAVILCLCLGLDEERGDEMQIINSKNFNGILEILITVMLETGKAYFEKTTRAFVEQALENMLKRILF